MARDVHGEQKSLERGVHDPSVQILAWRKGDGMEEEVQPAPVFFDAFEYGLELAFLQHIEGHEDRSVDLRRERLHVGLCLIVEIGHGKFCAKESKRLGAAVGDRLIVGDPGYQPPLAFECAIFRVEHG